MTSSWPQGQDPGTGSDLYDENGVLITPPVGGAGTAGSGGYGSTNTGTTGSGYDSPNMGDTGYGTGEGGESSGSTQLGWGYRGDYNQLTDSESWVEVGKGSDTATSTATKTVKSVSELNNILGDIKLEAVGNLADQGITSINANATWNIYYSPIDTQTATNTNLNPLSQQLSAWGSWSGNNGDTFTTNAEGESIAEISLQTNNLLNDLIANFARSNTDKNIPETVPAYKTPLFNPTTWEFISSDKGEICLSLVATEFRYHDWKGFDTQDPYSSSETKIINNPSNDPHRDYVSIQETTSLTPDIKLKFDNAFWTELKELDSQTNQPGGQQVAAEDLSFNWGDKSLASTGISTDSEGIRVIDVGAIKEGAETLTDFYKELESALAFDLNVDNFRRAGKANLNATFRQVNGYESITLSAGDHETSWTDRPSSAAAATSYQDNVINATLTDDKWTGTSFELELNSKTKIKDFLRKLEEAPSAETLWNLDDFYLSTGELYPNGNTDFPSGPGSADLGFQFKTIYDSNTFELEKNERLDASGFSENEGLIDTSAANGLNLDILKSEDFLDKIKLNLDKGYTSKLPSLGRDFSSTIQFDVYDAGDRLNRTLTISYDSDKGGYQLDSNIFKQIKASVYDNHRWSIQDGRMSIEDLEARDITLKLKQDGDAISININNMAGSGASLTRLSISDDGELTDGESYTTSYAVPKDVVTYSTPTTDVFGWALDANGYGYDSSFARVDYTDTLETWETVWETVTENINTKTSTNEFLDYLADGGSWAPGIIENIGEIKLENLWSAPDELQISSLKAKGSNLSSGSDDENSFIPDLKGKAIRLDYNLFDKLDDYDGHNYIDPENALRELGVVSVEKTYQDDVYEKEYILQITAEALDDYDLEGADITIGYDSRIFESIVASDITIGEEMPIANAIQITEGTGTKDADGNWTDWTNGTIRIAASSLSDMLKIPDGTLDAEGEVSIFAGVEAGEGIPYDPNGDGVDVFASIKLNFNEQKIEELGRNSLGLLKANPLEFTITANRDETILSKTTTDSEGYVNKSIQSLRDLGDQEGSSKVAATGNEVTLFEASVVLTQDTGIVMGTNRTIGNLGSDAQFTNLVRSGDTIKTLNRWTNNGNTRAKNIEITGILETPIFDDSGNRIDESGNIITNAADLPADLTDLILGQTNPYAQLIESESYFENDDAGEKNNLLGGTYTDGILVDTEVESGTVHAAIKITGEAGKVVDLSEGIYQIQAEGGAAQFNIGRGSKNLITFAGDVNYDGRVSMKDIAYLNAGAARQASGTTPQTTIPGANGEEDTVVPQQINVSARALDVDTNFDGTISMEDLKAIDTDWGKSLHNASESFTGMTNDFSWAQLDQQFYDDGLDSSTAPVEAGTWDNTPFKQSNDIEFGQDADYVAPLEVGEVAGTAVGGNGPNAVQDPLEQNPATTTANDIAGDYFQTD
ncbi:MULTISPECIES: hypothetical protein [unclassified Prochlorococcus]|uniref:hypothetical protein n=1 Tax=unclassified Prochlorococcus TaxID=2627481 RepID=UPI000533879B|nr:MULTISPECIES: hypothetical protein [unclassified Prochlorococcus]KGG27345.1 hypothetical protein EV12_1193 [Prochlorococcus sp. MIT 0701]KGG29411.1 hypothetical protein EV13_1061 [Prochlorococcus sp. MIT 0702]KGG34574.1 hypothetical protein EV14_1158 [Prochlorococcus sp. MIT 0703]